jgi:ABC-type dipeptide/oligopeptide/nickel transport system ATPase component
LPNPKRRWGAEGTQAETGAGQRTPKQGCKFANRCPYVMDVCRSAAPPLFQMDANRAAACYLYETAPSLTNEAMADVFVS